MRKGSISMKIKNVKLGTKITAGVIVVMILTASVAYIGWNSLQVVTDRFLMVDATESITKCILQARRHEKNFMIRGEKQYVDEVAGAMEKMKATAEDSIATGAEYLVWAFLKEEERKSIDDYKKHIEKQNYFIVNKNNPFSK